MDVRVSNLTAVPVAQSRSPALNEFPKLRKYLSDQIIGQCVLVDRLLIALLADGYLLVEGPPGLAKTRAIKALGVQEE